MLTVSNELKNAFMKDERTIYVRIKIGNRTFDNDNVISVDYDAGSLSGEVFAIGSTYSNSIKITFSELVEGLKELDEVTYEIGIKIPSGTIEYVPMGVFVINDAVEMDRNNNKTTIECMDRMVMMGGTYVSSLTYPAAIREVALEIANKAGIPVADTFDRLNADVIAKPEGYTYREAIGLIAQFEAGFATFNRYGKLEIKTLSDPNFAIPPDNYFSKGLVKNEVFFRLGGISCTTDDSDTVIQSGNKAGNQVILENRVMTKTLLDKIYQRIQTINYYPFSLSWQGNPVLEAGDWVEVEDLKGNKFKTPNLSYSLSFNGGLSAKSSAETVTQSDATYQYKSPLQQKIEWIHARIDAAGGNVVYEGIDEPVNPKEGDLWFKIIGPDKEILIYKKRVDGSLFWEPQISTADINKVAKEVTAAIKQADADREKAEQDFETAISEGIKYADSVTTVDVLKAKVLTANVITSDMIKTDTALINKLFATDANINVLTSKSAFINSVKAVDIVADRITGGTFNAANMNVVNLNANSITSGTITGARSNWNLNTGKFSTSGVANELIELENGVIRSYSPNRMNYAILDSGALRFQQNQGTGGQWVQISAYGTSYSSAAWQDIKLFRTNIGLGLSPGDNNTYSKNVVFSMYGVNPKIAFDVTDTNLNSIRNMLIEAKDTNIIATVSDRFRVDSNASGLGMGALEAGAFYSNSGVNGSVLKIEGDEITRTTSGDLYIMPGTNGTVVLGNKQRTGRYDIELNNGYFYGAGKTLRITGKQISLHNSSDSLYLTPSGSGVSVNASNPERSVYYPMMASAFNTVSERRFKSDIKPFDNALSLLSTLKVRQYEKDEKTEIGLITDESPLQVLSKDETAVSLYDLSSLNIRATQELTDITYIHERKLNSHDDRLAALEKENKLLRQKIEKLESVA